MAHHVKLPFLNKSQNKLAIHKIPKLPPCNLTQMSSECLHFRSNFMQNPIWTNELSRVGNSRNKLFERRQGRARSFTRSRHFQSVIQPFVYSASVISKSISEKQSVGINRRVNIEMVADKSCASLKRHTLFLSVAFPLGSIANIFLRSRSLGAALNRFYMRHAHMYNRILM